MIDNFPKTELIEVILPQDLVDRLPKKLKDRNALIRMALKWFFEVHPELFIELDKKG